MKTIKKLFLTLALVLVSSAAFAQKTSHALGFHAGGSSFDLEYRYYMDNSRFLDFTLGAFDFDKGFVISGTYNKVFQEWDHWTPNFATWKLWGGLGATLGVWDSGAQEAKNQFMVGPTGVLGFGFTVNELPLTVGLDYRPSVLMTFGNGFDIVGAGFRNFGITLTYQF